MKLKNSLEIIFKGNHFSKYDYTQCFSYVSGWEQMLSRTFATDPLNYVKKYLKYFN